MWNVIKIGLLISGLTSCHAGKSESYVQSRQNNFSSLTALAKAYGYVRYFHPTGAVENLNWQEFLKNAVVEMKDLRNPSLIQAKLSDLFGPYTSGVYFSLGTPSRSAPSCADGIEHFVWQHKGVGLNDTPNPNPDYPIYASKRVKVRNGTVENGLFNKAPDCNESLVKALDQNLYIFLPVSVPAEKDVVNGDTDRREQSDSQNNFAPDIIEVWAVMKHFYPYFDVVDVDWDAALVTALANAASVTDRQKFNDILLQLIEKLQDGHGYAFDARIPPNRRTIPVVFDRIEGQVVVTASTLASVQIGDFVQSIDGQSVTDFMKDAKAKVSGTEQWKNYRALNRYLGWGQQGSTAELELVRHGEVIQVIAERNSFPIREFEREELFKINAETFYIDLSRATMEKITQNIHKIARAKSLVLDMRGYPAGNHDIIRYLVDSPVQSAHFDVPQFIYPDQDRLVSSRPGQWLLEPLAPKINAKVAIIADSRAISYAESVLGIFENYQLAEIVAPSNTAGANGNVNALKTTNGFRVSFTGMRVTKHNGSQHHLIGIIPTVKKVRTIDGINRGDDELLNTALELVR